MDKDCRDTEERINLTSPPRTGKMFRSGVPEPRAAIQEPVEPELNLL
jgi:hypothetical protein